MRHHVPLGVCSSVLLGVRFGVHLVGVPGFCGGRRGQKRESGQCQRRRSERKERQCVFHNGDRVPGLKARQTPLAWRLFFVRPKCYNSALNGTSHHCGRL